MKFLKPIVGGTQGNRHSISCCWKRIWKDQQEKRRVRKVFLEERTSMLNSSLETGKRFQMLSYQVSRWPPSTNNSFNFLLLWLTDQSICLAGGRGGHNTGSDHYFENCFSSNSQWFSEIHNGKQRSLTI